MITVPTSEFRANMPAFLEKVKKGAKVSLTSHGKVVAMINPPSESDELRHRLERLRKGAWVGDILNPLGPKWEAQD